MREAIRKEKIEREYKQHQVNIHGQVKQEARRIQRHHSQQSRYRVTAKHRAIELNLLDNPKTEETQILNAELNTENKDFKSDESAADNDTDGDKETKLLDATNEENTADTCLKTDKKDVNIVCECDTCSCENISDVHVKGPDKSKTKQEENENSKIKSKKRHKNKSNKVPDAEKSKQKNGDTSLSQVVEEGGTYCLVDMEAEAPMITYDSLVSKKI